MTKIKGVTRLKHKDAVVYAGADTVDVIDHLTENGVRASLVFADPPFNYGRDYGKGVNDAKPREEYERWTTEWIGRSWRMLGRSGILVVNIPDEHASFIDWVATRGTVTTPLFTRLNWCIWHYRFAQNSLTRFARSKVHVLVYAKDPDSAVWNWEDILVPSDRSVVYGDKRTLHKKDGAPPGMRVPLDVWYGEGFSRITGNHRERRPNHDNQLPEAYTDRVIKAYTNKGAVVYDAFCGSGTMAVSCLRHGRKYIGAELNRKSAVSAMERIRAAARRAK
jgi:site-specific DNA-methyltransferase (adenine-specific)